MPGGWAGDYLKVLLVVGAIWWGVWACGLALDSEGRAHFLGASDKETIEVLAVEQVGDCIGKKERYELTYRTVGSEPLVRDVECRKRPRDLGRYDVWRVRDELHFASPTSERFWMLAAPFLFAGAVTWQRSRRRGRDSD